MRKRFLETIAAMVGLLGVIALLQTAPTPAAQAQAFETPWGAPDLQGIWTDQFETPLERPAQYANAEAFTNAERADLDKRRTAHPRREARAGPGTERDVRGAYNAVFQSVRPTGPRTSLIVDPPDGRIPSLTSEAQERRAVQ